MTDAKPKKTGKTDQPVDEIVGDYPERPYEDAMSDAQREVVAKRTGGDRK